MSAKKQAGKPTANDAALEEKKLQLASINRQCEGYERMMVVCSEQLQRSQLESQKLKKRIADLDRQFEEQESKTHQKSMSMFRMYVAGRDQLQARIARHEETIEELRQQLDDARRDLEQTKEKKDAEIAEKTKQINEQKQKMEEMAIAFGVKLKETLEQMSHHIQQGRDDFR